MLAVSSRPLTGPWWRTGVLCSVGSVRWAWQAPNADCYKLLGVSPSATKTEIRESYLRKALQCHPDKSGEQKEMAALNLCYEALTKRRAEYDASRGAGGHSSRPDVYPSWWQKPKHESPSPDFDDFGEWEDYFDRSWQSARAQDRNQKTREDYFGRSWRAARAHDRNENTRDKRKAQSWKQWADSWRREHDATFEEGSFKKPFGRRNRSWGRYEDFDSEDDESSTDSEDDDSYRGRRRHRRGQRPSKRQQHFHEDTDPYEAEFESRRQSRGTSRRKQKSNLDEAPQELWVAIRGGERGNFPGGWEKLIGKYTLMNPHVNERPAYQKKGEKALHLFWSREYRDWKLAEHFDDGACVAFMPDDNGKRFPWEVRVRQWKLWEPKSRRFVSRKLSIEACVEEEQRRKDDSEPGEVPWSRLPWHKWSTADLVQWCGRHHIDISGCFDRESILEQVKMSAAHSFSSRGQRHTDAESSNSDTENEDSHEEAPRRGQRQRQQRGNSAHADKDGFEGVVLASRMKTDGSYTRPPSLDPRIYYYGNRVEEFVGEEEEVLPWLHEYGDRSRLYGVYISGSFSYPLVWTKRKTWDRPGSRTHSKR